MSSSPPRVETTEKSASINSQRKPYHRAKNTSTPTTTVRAELYQVLNRLAWSHPTNPVSRRGGGKVAAVVGSLTVDTGQTQAMRICRL